MILWIITLLVMAPSVHGNLINRIDNPCIPSIYPEYLTDDKAGSYCRFDTKLSQIDFLFLLQLSTTSSDEYIQKVQSVLYHSLMLHEGSFSNDTNDAAFVSFADHPALEIGYGNLTDYLQVASQFNKMKAWKQDLNNSQSNFTAALEYVDANVFNYNNRRPKFLIIVTDNEAQTSFQFNQNDIHVAENIKNKGVEIFGVIYSNYNMQILGTYISKISTTGWIYKLKLNPSSATDSALSNMFYNYARQTGCKCGTGTTQFTSLTSTSDPDIPFIKSIYADCVFTEDEYVGTFEEAESFCQSNVTITSRPLAINTSIKWTFVKEYFNGNEKNYWSGLNGLQWRSYYQTELELNFMPDTNQEIMDICQSVYNISLIVGYAGAVIAHNNSRIFCQSTPDLNLFPACESKALDSLDNPRLCPSPFGQLHIDDKNDTNDKDYNTN